MLNEKYLICHQDWIKEDAAKQFDKEYEVDFEELTINEIRMLYL